METNMNDLEGLRIAMDIEARCYNFYKMAFEKFTDEKIKALFKMLMEEEDEHLKIFSKYFEELTTHKEAHDSEYLFDPDVAGYITVLAESHVFPSKEKAPQVLAKIDSSREVLALAMGAEKDSILLYTELIACSKFPQAREVFTKLKHEEQGHVRELSQKIKEILQ